MMRQRLISMIVVTAVLSGTFSEWSGTAAQARPHARSTAVRSRRANLGRWMGPPRGRLVHTLPWRPRLIRRGHPYLRPLVVPGSVGRRIVIRPLPRIALKTPTVRIKPTTLTLWVTNSNGSRIAVELTKDGAWYVGPHGECYASIPTNEQLRVVYGF